MAPKENHFLCCSVFSFLAIYLQNAWIEAFCHKIGPMLLKSGDVAFVYVTPSTKSSKVKSLSTSHLPGKVQIGKMVRRNRNRWFLLLAGLLEVKVRLGASVICFFKLIHTEAFTSPESSVPMNLSRFLCLRKGTTDSLTARWILHSRLYRFVAIKGTLAIDYLSMGFL